MQRKISSKWSLLIIGVVGVVCCSIIIFFLNLDRPGQDSYIRLTSPAKSQLPQNLIGSKPVKSAPSTAFAVQANSGLRLKIPTINVDAVVKSVGLTSDGAMDAPKGPIEAAWFNLGPRPGETGSAVIDGHFGSINGVPAVFNNLYKLQPGDKLSVEDETGAITIFVVRMSRSYDPAADASDVFGSNDGQAHLNLITCEGVWDKTKKSYSDRLVVFTDKEMK